jgi:hypothetical protein
MTEPMTTDKLIRWAGLATILGGICMVLFPILHPNHDAAGYTGPMWIPAHLMPHIAAITLLFGLPALYARQGERNGRLGLAGYVLATIATAQLLMVAWVELFIMPFIGLQMPGLEEGPPPPGIEVAGLIMNQSLAIGYFVLGLGIVRARVLPRGAGVLLMIAAPLFSNLFGDTFLRQIAPDLTLDTFFLTMTLFGLAIGWVGLGLWTGRGERRPVGAAEGSARGLAPARASA